MWSLWLPREPSDQAHSLTHPWWSLKEMQLLATGDIFGKSAGVLHPFDHLRVNDFKKELEVRGITIGNGTLKDALQKELNEILGGVARVPALLLTNPTQSLLSLWTGMR